MGKTPRAMGMWRVQHVSGRDDGRIHAVVDGKTGQWDWAKGNGDITGKLGCPFYERAAARKMHR